MIIGFDSSTITSHIWHLIKKLMLIVTSSLKLPSIILKGFIKRLMFTVHTSWDINLKDK